VESLVHMRFILPEVNLFCAKQSFGSQHSLCVKFSLRSFVCVHFSDVGSLICVDFMNSSLGIFPQKNCAHELKFPQTQHKMKFTQTKLYTK